MRLKWNPTERSFEAEFQDFNGDLAAVKAAGFKTTGPPNWVWYCTKIAPLDKLRKNRPASGLTILEDALAVYTRLKQQDEQNIALKAELKKAKKPSAEKEVALPTPVPEGQEFGYYPVEIKESEYHMTYKPPVFTGPYCQICNGPVYFFEQLDPPVCLWCELGVDNAPDLF